MNIQTDFLYLPVPLRGWDWAAWDDSTYDGTGPVGYGATEAEAIINLLDQLEEV